MTGGTGMVGSNFLEHPSAREFEVLAPTRSELDLRNFKKLQKYIYKHKPEFVIHAAGKVGGIQTNIRYPVKFFLENIEIGKNIIMASREANIKKLINLACSCIYPINHNKPLKEELVLKGELEPTNEAYALAKIAIVRLCKYINQENFKFKYKTLIPCNLYGRYDNFNPSNSHLIPAIIHKVYLAKKKEKKSVKIWGDGLSRREFMYSGDFASILIKAIKRFNSLPDVMNVGLGCDQTIKKYYQEVAKVIGYQGVFINDFSKPTGMKRKLVSIALQKNWGWSCYTNLQDGIKKTYDFYLKEIAHEI